MKKSWQLLVLVILVACQPMIAPPTPIPTSEPPIRYELRQPQPDELLRLIDAVLLMEEQMTYNNDVTSAILEREAGSLHHLIGEDFERYYLGGFSGAEDLVLESTLPWEMKSFGDLESFNSVLRIAFLQYINRHQSILDNSDALSLPNSNVRSFQLNLDGDQNPEWLIGVEYQDYSLQNWLLIAKRDDGLYHLLPDFAGYDFTGAQNYITDIEIKDLTGDGNDEIIKIRRYYFAGGLHGWMEIYTWKEGKLSLFDTINLPDVPPVYGEVNESNYEIDDFDGDGIDDVRVNWPRFLRFGCQWTQNFTYFFVGGNVNVNIEGEEIPQVNECLIARALATDNLEERIRFYQDAIEKFDLNTSPPDELAWLRLNLAMMYTAVGDDGWANLQLQELIDSNGDGKFLEFIQVSYAEANSPSPILFCELLYSSIASQVIPDSIGSEIDIDLTHGAYPIDYAPMAYLVCPFPEVFSSRLANLKIPLSKSPIDVLVADGYSFVWTKSMNWDDDSELEWLGVLDFHQPMLVFIDGKENWNINAVKVNLSSVSDFSSAIHSSADGSETKVLVLLTGMGRFCSFPDTDKWLIEFDPNSTEHETYYLCDTNQYLLANESDIQYALDEFTKPNNYETFDAPDWYYLPDAGQDEYERPTILSLVGEIENDVVSQNNPNQTRLAIEKLIDSLPKDDPAAQILLRRLIYLRGLNYELSGQSELAVMAYRELTLLFPESLWGQYASMRLQAIQP